jgi:hypothetical protein
MVAQLQIALLVLLGLARACGYLSKFRDGKLRGAAGFRLFVARVP